MLIKASTHELRFLETGGGGILGSCDDAFIAASHSTRRHIHGTNKRRAEKLNNKTAQKAAEGTERKPLEIPEAMEKAKANADGKRKGISSKELHVFCSSSNMVSKRRFQEQKSNS